MIRFRGVPVRDIHGLPYTVHQIGDEQWQIVIQNCARYPAGYTFAPVYGAYDEAMGALESWPIDDAAMRGAGPEKWAGDDTGIGYVDAWEMRDPFHD